MTALPAPRAAPAGPPAAPRLKRPRMAGPRRRQQLLDVGRAVFAENGFDATTVEEVARRAEVSKPVVYAHFGGKDGLYAAVVEREMGRLLGMVTEALSGGHPRELLEQAARALLDYVENQTDGFRVLARGSGVGSSTGTLTTLLGEVAMQVTSILGREFELRGYSDALAAMYAQMLVGMVAFTGQWWLDVRVPERDDVVAHVVNLAWNGLSRLEQQPLLWTSENVGSATEI